MKKKKPILILITILIFTNLGFAQSNFYEPLDIDTVSWSTQDFGKMWTFDNVPIKKFKEKYNFEPTEEWLKDVQKSALQFGGGCSAAFVSEDGLIMTNHHCGRNRLSSIQKEGEDLLKDGFYAKNLNDERKIENLFVDQLMNIKDVTSEIKSFMSSGKSDNEKIHLRDEIKDSLEKKYSQKTDFNCKIVTLYHGGKYSLYTYKRYNDIRLVMSPDFQIAATGWDWDNFTYPRYELDFMFLRAYDENGNPVKSMNHFGWSKAGAKDGESIFVIGRPGSTRRLLSIAQLEYLRDQVYPLSLIGYNEIYYAYYNYYQNHTDNETLLNKVMGWGNSRKSYAGRLAGLNNEYIMRKKNEFQKNLINKVKSNPELNEKYGHVWEGIDTVINKLGQYSDKNTVVRFNRFLRPEYYKLAEEIIKIAKQKELADDERDEKYKNVNLEQTIESIYPKNIDFEIQDNLLEASVQFLTKVLGERDPLVINYFGKRKGREAVEFIKNKSELLTKQSFSRLAQKEAEEILSSNDPFIKYIMYIEKLSKEIGPKVMEFNNTLSVLNELLGEVIYKVYGDIIPPDATSTLRISDGIIKGYEYNGTIAPGKTTYYGLWDRYESFNKKTYPWGLHPRWRTPPKELDLSTNIGFASTNDIVGGNSGSSIINKNKEVVGLVHDGNLESLAGDIIFMEENNRTVASDSKGLIEALKYVYKTDRLVEELIKGKIN